MISCKLKRLPPVLSHWTCCDDRDLLHLCSPNMVAISHIGLLSTWNVVSMTEESKFLFYLILITLNVNSHVLVSTILDSAVLDSEYILSYPIPLYLGSRFSLFPKCSSLRSFQENSYWSVRISSATVTQSFPEPETGFGVASALSSLPPWNSSCVWFYVVPSLAFVFFLPSSPLNCNILQSRS